LVDFFFVFFCLFFLEQIFFPFLCTCHCTGYDIMGLTFGF
jgi:hypothetical protein